MEADAEGSEGIVYHPSLILSTLFFSEPLLGEGKRTCGCDLCPLRTSLELRVSSISPLLELTEDPFSLSQTPLS